MPETKVFITKPDPDLSQMIESQDGRYSCVDIDTELPYLEICDEFEIWLQEMEARNNAARMAELGFSL